MVCKPCAVPKCESKDGVRFRFPHPINAKQRFEKWLEILKNPLLYSLDPMNVYNIKRICTRHFSNDCFVKPNKIKYSSVPTLHVPDPEAAKTWNYSNTTDYINTNKLYYINKKPENNIENCNESIECEVISEEFLEEEILAIKVDERCRVCLEIKENRLPLDYKTNIYKEESLTLLEIIHNFCNVEIALNDDKPQTICVECAEKLRAMYETTLCCEKNDLILEEEISKNVKNTVKENTKQKVTNHKLSNDYSSINENRSQKIKVLENVNINNKCPKQKKKKALRKCEIIGQCTVVCLYCHRYFKRQHRNKVINHVFIRKKPHICSCGARFGNSKKLIIHAMIHL